MRKVNATLELDPHSMVYTVEMSPDEARRFVARAMDYNDATPERLVRLVEQVNGLVPPMTFGGTNPNNGKPHHTVGVGRECSRVLYLKVRKFYMPDYDFSTLERRLDKLGREAWADESWTTVDDEHEFVFRWWWD